MPNIQHQIVTLDAQPTFNNGIITFVCGNLIIDGNQNQPIKFATLSTWLSAVQQGTTVIMSCLDLTTADWFLYFILKLLLKISLF